MSRLTFIMANGPPDDIPFFAGTMKVDCSQGYLVAKKTVYPIIKDCCQHIYDVLSPRYLKVSLILPSRNSIFYSVNATIYY